VRDRRVGRKLRRSIRADDAAPGDNPRATCARWTRFTLRASRAARSGRARTALWPRGAGFSLRTRWTAGTLVTRITLRSGWPSLSLDTGYASCALETGCASWSLRAALALRTDRTHRPSLIPTDRRITALAVGGSVGVDAIDRPILPQKWRYWPKSGLLARHVLNAPIIRYRAWFSERREDRSGTECERHQGRQPNTLIPRR
jgi:hypothetical protein